MSKFTSEMVDNLADKLLIGLTREENKLVLDEFEIIDKNIDIINELDGLDKVEPMTHTLDNFEYELREDVAKDSIPVDVALRNAAKTEGREIEVPKVVE